MTYRTQGWIMRALFPTLVLATALGLTATLGGCTDEIVDDSAESDCDQDSDGHRATGATCGGDDCNDLDEEVYPGHGCSIERGAWPGSTNHLGPWLRAGCTSRTCCIPKNRLDSPDACPS